MLEALSVPSFTQPSEGYKVYQQFRGIDLLTDDTQIDDSRSPWAVNLISDAGGYPEKRVGWRTLHQFSDKARINGLWSFVIDGEKQMIVHAGTRLLKLKQNV